MSPAEAAPTFFARPGFASALERVYPHMRAETVTEEEAGVRFHVPVMSYRSRSGFTHAQAFPFGGYSCVFRDDGSTADAQQSARALQKAAARFTTFTFTPWPLAEPPVLPGWERTECTTAVIDCSGGVEAALANMRGVTRRMVGQSVRRGVVCERVRPDAAALARYYAMLVEASRGWGLERPTIPLDLFEAVFAYGRDDAELWFARCDDEVIAGGVVLCGSQELFFWSAAMRREFSRLRPSNALNARLIERTCERGLRWYNLGASHELEGVSRFKHDLGARDVPYATIRRSRQTFSVLSRVAYKLRARTA